VKLTPLPEVPTKSLPVEDVHHEMVFPVDVAFRLVIVPAHTLAGWAVTFVGVVDVARETVVLTQVVVLQVPSALTQYVVKAVGITGIVVPEARKVPPQELVYQSHSAPEIKDPPVKFKVLPFPVQTLEGEAEAEVAAVFVPTVIAILKQAVELQVPFALTQ